MVWEEYKVKLLELASAFLSSLDQSLFLGENISTGIRLKCLEKILDGILKKCFSDTSHFKRKSFQPPLTE